MKIIALAILLVSCAEPSDVAEKHLSALGYKHVACEHGGLMVCIADSVHYRCLVDDPEGCSSGGPRVACERFYTENPAPN